MAVVPLQCWMRTFKVEFTGGSASCFVVTHRDRQWLITAKHVVDAAVRHGAYTFTLTGENGLAVELAAPMVPVPLVEAGPDIAVFSLGDNKIVRDDMTLVPSAVGVALSQEVFFLGYPMPGTLPLSGRLPAVRRGIVSQRAVFDGGVAWIIDGHNLPGFSGGPLVFANHGGQGPTWHVLGVVSAYVQHRIAVEITGGAIAGNLGLTVPSNAGLVVVYDIKHAIDAIDAFIAADN
ncbi:serine protease [Mycobacterium intracellulare]|uniref:S1 family peptidase n=1 Tax=Mycobacterium intracellulare TaxID=1767 RepID=UPI003558ACA5